MSVEVPDHYICTSTNFSTRISDAIDLGQITILTFGDSIPSFGPTPWFPENVAQFFNQFAPSSEINLAVPGTVTDNWLPGTSRFATLSEQVPQADVIIFSLGGNDLLYYVEGISAGSIPEMMEHLNDLDPLLDRIQSNLETIYYELRTLAPKADIVWLLYPNYATSDQWASYTGEYTFLIEGMMDNKLRIIRGRMSESEGLMIADIFGGTADIDLDDLLFDPLHLNSHGHRYYAAEIFMTLGGVIMNGDYARGQERMIGFFTGEEQ